MSQNCHLCSKNKATLKCGLCQAEVCKTCVTFLEPGQFSFYSQIPEVLTHEVYCHGCYDSTVAPELEKYNQMLLQARDINVFEKAHGKETRFIRRTVKPVKVIDCADYDEALLRLAFFAVQSKHNAIIDVEIKSKKVSHGKYQTSLWSGSAVPANVQSHQLMKDRALWQNPN